MAEGVLFDVAKGITEKVGSLVAQEIVLLWNLKDEIEKLKDTVLTISAVLQDAEEKQQHNNQVRVWLKRLNDALYEADDLLDDISTEALRREVMTRNKKAKESKRSMVQDDIGRMKHEAMQDIGEVDWPLIFVPLPVRISQRFVGTGNSSVSHLTTKMQKEVCEVFHKICYILELEGDPIQWYFPTTWERNLSESFQSAKRVRTGLRFHLSPTWQNLT
ncbi:hypothetical protein SO802_008368 [Lithocarpus litseifolius]|uniref:Disease resistance N-terminal domain-containing protein n=1 Tax=Lithocarpus litseifolius TaxID=425828 RepID=A0AAW2D929_9ROSI